MPFYWLLVLSLEFLLLQLASAIYILVQNWNLSSPSWIDTLKYGNACSRILLGIQIVICILCGYILAMLLWLHTVLRIRGMTTYTFILMHREWKELQEMYGTRTPRAKSAIFSKWIE